MLPTGFLMDAAIKATVIFAAAYLAALALRGASAAARYFVWTTALAAALAIPVLSLVLPAWGVRVNARAIPSVASEIPVVEDAPLAAPIAPPVRKSVINWPLGIWLAGSLLMLLRLAVGHVRLALSLGRAPKLSAPAWLAARDAAAARIGLGRVVQMRRSSETDVPLTGGLFSPTVVLPAAADEWDADRRRVVLLHELTHARRWDPALWFLARLAVSVYWFHPLAWLALARFRREQERSCDDAVIRSGEGQPAYAGQLVDLARAVAPARTYSAALGMAATSDLEQRVRAILDPRRDRRGLRRGFCLAAAVIALAAILPLAAVHAQQSGTTASLSGTIYDPGGAVIPRVLVLLKNSSQQDAARANAVGEYKFAVPAGSYTLEVREPGFAEFRKAIVLPVDSRTNIALAVGSVTESMEVVGKAAGPPETGIPHRIRIGGNVQATKLITMVKPVYPPNAESAGIEGTVLLRAVISMDGGLLGLTVVNTSVDAELANAAMDAVKQWRYQPTLLNGEPVEVVTTIAVTFRLER